MLVSDSLIDRISLIANLPTGPDRFDEAVGYTEKYQLYDAALAIWKDTERYLVCPRYALLLIAKLTIRYLIDHPWYLR